MNSAAAVIVGWILRGLIALVFIGMGGNHFRRRSARGMAAMIPPALRFEGVLAPVNLVYFTGLCELAGGVGLLVPWTRLPAALALVVFLCAVFPANTYAAQHPEKFGRFAIPFWPRYFGQLLLIIAIMAAALLP